MSDERRFESFTGYHHHTGLSMDVKREMRHTCRVHGRNRGIWRQVEGKFRCSRCSVEAVTRRRRKMKAMAVAYKGGRCEVCGYDTCLRALTFHHLDPKKKDNAVGMFVSWARVKVEIDKCQLLCANCHMELHDAEVPG